MNVLTFNMQFIRNSYLFDWNNNIFATIMIKIPWNRFLKHSMQNLNSSLKCGIYWMWFVIYHWWDLKSTDTLEPQPTEISYAETMCNSLTEELEKLPPTSTPQKIIIKQADGVLLPISNIIEIKQEWLWINRTFNSF